MAASELNFFFSGGFSPLKITRFLCLFVCVILCPAKGAGRGMIYKPKEMVRGGTCSFLPLPRDGGDVGEVPPD